MDFISLCVYDGTYHIIQKKHVCLPNKTQWQKLLLVYLCICSPNIVLGRSGYLMSNWWHLINVYHSLFSLCACSEVLFLTLQ